MTATSRDEIFGEGVSRRRFLATAAGALAAAALPGALAPAARASSRGRAEDLEEREFVFSRFNYKMSSNETNKWDYGGEFDENFLGYLREATNIPVSSKRFEERAVQASDEASFLKSPFWFMIGDGDFSLTDAERDVLAEFFKRGGFLWGDDCVREGGHPVDVFYRAFVRELPQVLPDARLSPAGPDNAIYHCFYDFPEGKAPYYKGGNGPDMGLFLENRMVAFLTPSDVHCAWRMDRPKYPGLQAAAFRMGTNVVVYALTH
ncbi:DUF4159 domain-containing protein [Candidatus Sumerlaeota bacterium]|nr:DUF4159 domain-containing protein [Candidatus Sumerlaeota bacterium]